MNNFIGISLTVLILLIFGSNSALSQDFPTDIGSFVMSGSFSTKSSESTPFDYYEKRTGFSGSINYMLFLDISLGIRTEYEKISNGNGYRTDFVFGPQFIWYVGGHMHKTELAGDFYQYFGFGILHRKWKKNQYVGGSGNSGYELLTHSSYMYRLSFGLMIMINNNIGVFGEGAVNLFNGHHFNGTEMINAGPAGEATLDAGLILFLY